jgi:molecular chaperone Hsp33
MLDEGMSPEDMLKFILGDMDLEINDRTDVSFECNCSRERVSRAMISIGRKELKALIDENKSQDVFCDYCEKHYYFSPEELHQLYEAAK